MGDLPLRWAYKGERKRGQRTVASTFGGPVPIPSTYLDVFTHGELQNGLQGEKVQSVYEALLSFSMSHARDAMSVFVVRR